MELKQSEISKVLPCRETIIKELFELIGDPEEPFPASIYLYGHTGTGKTSILQEFHKQSWNSTKYVILDCIECYTSKILFESILNQFFEYTLKKADNFGPYVKCDNLKDFIGNLQSVDRDKSYVICLDNAERIRDMDFNILSGFMRLNELTGLNICCIFVSQLPFEKYYTKTGLPEIYTIHCQQYSKVEILKILVNDFANVHSEVLAKIEEEEGRHDPEAFEKKYEILVDLQSDFYENYLNLFLSFFYKACRDLPELRLISRDCFHVYLEPILNGTIDKNDVSKLWRNITKPLRIALSQVYMRIDNRLELQNTEDFHSDQSIRKLAQSLELPYYAKYLLIAAFLASHNSTKEDKRLFVKNHGKQRKRMQTVNANAKVTDKMSTTLGPKSFSIDRLLAIFYAILDEKVGLTCNLLAQISTLVHLKFLCYVSGENNVMEGSAKLQCTVGLDFILYIGKVVGFNVRQYLCDFM